MCAARLCIWLLDPLVMNRVELRSYTLRGSPAPRKSGIVGIYEDSHIVLIIPYNHSYGGVHLTYTINLKPKLPLTLFFAGTEWNWNNWRNVKFQKERSRSKQISQHVDLEISHRVTLYRVI